MKNVNTFRRFSCTLVISFALLAVSNYSQAATINVTANATDTLNGTDGQCSLREAITNINDGASTYADCSPAGVYGASDTINIPAGTYITTIADIVPPSGENENLNVSGDYDINKSVSIVGAGSGTTIINGGGLNRVFHIDPELQGSGTPVIVSISGVTITGGYAIYAYGGGILNWGTLSITNTIVSNNVAVGSNHGGGIYNFGTLTVTNSIISGNTAASSSGGIFAGGGVTINNSTISGNTAALGTGGGISAAGTLTITNSTISGNNAPGISGYVGGGIMVEAGTTTITNSTITGNTSHRGAGIFNADTLLVTNSTISGNTAVTEGGGISNFLTATITNSTIVRNSAQAGLGGGIFWQGGTIALTNSIVADNGAGLDCSGTIINSGGNIDSDSSCTGFTHSAAMVQGTGFSALAGNGGPTQTHALLTGSAAIDAAPTCAGLIVDQRGTVRPQGSNCDVGAYEVVVVPVPPPASPPGPVTPVTPIVPNAGSGGGCFIATAAYGSYLHPQVQLLRNFRDDYLLTTVPGRAFVAFYYRSSPPLADFIGRHPILRAITRLALTPLFVVIAHPVISALSVILLIGTVLVAYLRRFKGCATKICDPSSGHTS